RGGVLVVLHLREREVGVDDAEIANGVYFHADVVAGDDVLRGNIEGFETQADAIERRDRPEYEADSSFFSVRYKTAQTEDHAAFQFFDDVERIPEPQQQDTESNQPADPE